MRDGAFADREVEILVADNGSTDASEGDCRARAGARVQECPVRGYGAALRCGFQSAANDIVIFADADSTYDFGESPALIEQLEAGNDLVLGSRIRGTIEPGAMPFLHRYLGAPMLTFVLNLLHASRGQRVSDCNSGFRCFRRESFMTWGARATGMEFASEMLIKAMKSGARIAETPITLHPDKRRGTPHLRRWRDGMRHLLVILAESPRSFYRFGVTTFLLSWVILLVGLSRGPIELARFNAFGLHSMMFALLGTCLGLNIFGIGLLLYARSVGSDRAPEISVYHALLQLDEGRLFWGCLGFIVLGMGVCVPILRDWAAADFRFLDLHKQTLVLVAFGADGVFFLFNVIAAHLVKDR